MLDFNAKLGAEGYSETVWSNRLQSKHQQYICFTYNIRTLQHSLIYLDSPDRNELRFTSRDQKGSEHINEQHKKMTWIDSVFTSETMS